jgi:hypothetical protein
MLMLKLPTPAARLNTGRRNAGTVWCGPLLLALTALPTAAFAAAPASPAWLPTGISLERPYLGYVGPEACRQCHADHADSQGVTAHEQASLPATAQTIMGSFADGRNRLPTREADKDLLMEARDGAYYQSLVLRATDRDVRLRSGRFAIVVGAVKGQTYLYWRDDVLCQLPASYATGADVWAYSPGYPDGVPYFDRVIKPDCMECHATTFETVLADRLVKSDKAILGVTCEACHGPGEAHVRHHQQNPNAVEAAYLTRITELSRDQQVEACGYCHSGVKPDSRTRPPFTFRPGDRLADFFQLKPIDPEQPPEVHGNQMGLLQQSACYRQSEILVCTTCHDPHARDRGRLDEFAKRCVACHEDLEHPPEVANASDLANGCVDCHMPLVDSRLIDVAERGQRHHFAVRSHWIGVYRN